MATKLSDEQLLIVNAPISNILVSAAAGSGKTTVLVERIVTKIMNGEFDIDNILVMTFTREAANNMRSKIEKKLREKISELKSKGGSSEMISRLYRQLDLLPNSYIQTIDAFCSRVIKEKGYVCADDKDSELLESGSFVLDGNELKVLLINAVNLSISQMYEDYGDTNKAFLALTNMYGNGRTDDSLAESLAESFKKLRSLPDYLTKCDEIISKREKDETNGVIYGIDEIISLIMTSFNAIDSDLINNLREMTGEITFVKTKNSERQQAFLDLYDIIEEYVNKVKEVYSSTHDAFKTIEVIKDRYFLDRMVKSLFNGFLKPEEKDDPQLFTRYMDDFGAIAALIKFLKPFIDLPKMPAGYGTVLIPYEINDDYQFIFTCDKDDLLKRQKARTDIIRAYVELLKKIDVNFKAVKERVHGVDFADQTHLAKKILGYDEARLYYMSKFTEIYIDEYQDNSEIQDKIIELFALTEGNTFRVGDVKQSIYKFRYAEPNLFMGKMNAYTEVKSEENFKTPAAEGLLFLLNNNYRSDKTVLDFINSIFYSIMTEEGAEISYDEKQQLNFPKTKDLGEMKKPRVLLVNHEDKKDNNLSMCYGVLKEVELLLESGVKEGEICVLTRKHVQADKISTYLNDHGHKSVYADELAVFDDNDIHAICNVIMALGNSYRDEFLLGVLISPYMFSNFTLDEVARIIAFSNKHQYSLKYQSLIEKVRYFSCEAPEGMADLKIRSQKFIDTFDSLRNDQIITDIGELIDRIYKESGIGATLGKSSPKLNMFKDWLCSNFLRYGSDISRISSELESMKIKLGGNASVSSKAATAGDAIKCMTYHASKGLEYKAVIVTELNASVSNKNSFQILFDSRSGFVSNDYFEDTVRLDTSIEMMAFKNEQLIYENSEILRLLYVALTRAKDRLSVVLPLSLNSKGYSSLYRLIAANKKDTFDKSHWLKCKKSMEYAFLSGLLKLGGSEELADVLKEISDPLSDEGITFASDFDGFELEIDTPDLSALSIDLPDESEDEDSDESTDESSDNDEDEVSMRFEEKEGLISLNAEGFDQEGYPVFAKYPYEEVSKYPFKVSVSGIKNGLNSDTMPVNLTVNGLSYFASRANGDVGETPSELGTFVHKILRFIDLGLLRNNDISYETEIDSLIADRIISKNDKFKAMSYKDGIIAFANSSVGERLIKADELGKASYEKPVVFSIPVGDSGDVVLVQGIIDLLFEEDGEYVLVDYKTDTFPDSFDENKRANKAREMHSSQINYYKDAVEKSGLKVKESYLYLVNYNQFVCV